MQSKGWDTKKLRAFSFIFVMFAVVMLFAVPGFSAIQAPANVHTSYVSGGVDISWGAVVNTSKYNVYESTDNSTFNLLGNTTSTSYLVNLTADGTYYFKIEAVDVNNASDTNSTIISVKFYPPESPNGLTATVQAGKVTLSWNAVTNATGYYIYRGTSAGNETRLVSVDGTNYTDTNVVGGNTYYYYVVAYNNTGISKASQELKIAISSGGGIVTVHNYKFNSYLFGFGVLLIVFALPLMLYGARRHKDVAKYALVFGILLIIVSWALVQFGYNISNPLTLFGVALNAVLVFLGVILLIAGIAMILTKDYDRRLMKGHIDIARFSIGTGILALIMAYLVSVF